MRISDWSSDVCSSDLVQSLRCPAHEAHPGRSLRVRQAERLHVLPDPEALRRPGILDAGDLDDHGQAVGLQRRSEEHTSELQSLMRISYAVFCLKKKRNITQDTKTTKRTTRYKKKHRNTT